MTDVVIIGAGFGGLASAVELAAAGLSVTVIEALPNPGGKAGIAHHEGVTFDTGPSVLTLPDIFDRVFRAANTKLEDEVELLRLDPTFRYLWPDGSKLDLFHDSDATLASVRDEFGGAAADDFREFLGYAREVWDTAAPHFVFGDAPTMGTLLRLGTRAFGAMRRIDSFRSMRHAIRSRVRSPHLRMLFERYATYNGSDPGRAPATLNCIAHVEMGLGFFGVKGGIHALVQRLVAVAEARGATFRFGVRAVGIAVAGERAQGVELDDGSFVKARAVIANADIAHVASDLLLDVRHDLPRTGEPSTSGWNGVLKATPSTSRVAHTVVFPKDYREEFQDLFEHRRPPRDPTLYMCAQHLAHGRDAWPPDARSSNGYRPVFIMANAPAEPATGASDPSGWEALEARIGDRLRKHGLAAGEDRFVWTRTPTDLARTFPGTRGAIYGLSSNGWATAFQRPSNRVAQVRGLYLASGGAHPGGGMPLCLQSGRAAAAALLKDIGPAGARVA